jgi:ubiquinone/menaquinone biosynthesis C-methylase UbiE
LIALRINLPSTVVFPWVCVAASLLLAVVALLRLAGTQPSSRRSDVVILRSPVSGLPLTCSPDGKALVSAIGESFPIHRGIPNFLQPGDLTGANRKYNHLYQTIAGFYDDSQRFFCAFSNMDRDAYVRSYLGFLEVKPGDCVLETSVGTGLNFKYLPRDIQRFGLDLSPEMLANCQTNLRRWQMDADLVLGNAESLPFADNSFDVVFHVGGINFFSDHARAIREMIRVAKPGTLILIADETEQHVKESFENIPYTAAFYQGRDQAVTAPINLLPPEMQDVHLANIFNNRFYALSFRKPGADISVASENGAGAVRSS